MTDMKCPFCEQKLNTENYYIHCHNPHCDITADMEGNEELWQALIDAYEEKYLSDEAVIERTKELNDTKKKLDIAVDALDYIKKNCMTMIEAESACRKALEQITALEQKDK